MLVNMSCSCLRMGTRLTLSQSDYFSWEFDSWTKWKNREIHRINLPRAGKFTLWECCQCMFNSQLPRSLVPVLPQICPAGPVSCPMPFQHISVLLSYSECVSAVCNQSTLANIGSMNKILRTLRYLCIWFKSPRAHSLKWERVKELWSLM